MGLLSSFRRKRRASPDGRRRRRLPLRLQPVNLDLNLEVKVEISEVDEVGECESVALHAVDGGEHLAGDDAGLVLDEDDEVVDDVLEAAVAEEAQELGLQGEGEVGDGDGATGAS